MIQPRCITVGRICRATDGLVPAAISRFLPRRERPLRLGAVGQHRRLKVGGLRNHTLAVMHGQGQVYPQSCRPHRYGAIMAKLRVAGVE